MNQRKVHEVESVHGDESYLSLRVDGQPYRIRWENCSEKLLTATDLERNFVRVSPAGYGLHW